MKICPDMYLVSPRLLVGKILNTYIELKNSNNIFWLVFLDKVLDRYKVDGHSTSF